MKEFIGNLKFAWKYAKDEKRRIIVYILLTILSIIVGVVTPILSARLMILFSLDNYQKIILIALVILLVDYVSNSIGYITNTYSTIIYNNALSNLDVDLGRNILKIENSCLDKKGSGIFIERLTNDTSRLAESFDSFLSLLSNIIKYIGLLIAILIVNRLLFVYVVISIIVLYKLENTRTIKKNELDKIYRKSNENVSSFIGELVRGSRDIRMLNSEEAFLVKFSNSIVESNNKRKNMEIVSWKYKILSWNLADTFLFLEIVFLVILISKGMIVPTVAVVLYNYYMSLANSFYTFGSLLEFVKDFNLSCSRIKEILYDSKFTKENFGQKHISMIEGNFEFKNVKFSYDDNIILNKLNFKINSNETVAFVGKSGAGKTTIFNLLCKMYRIDDGKITIDGIDIQELDKDSIRGNITVISQNPYIFNMSIKDNLRLVKSDLTDEEMYDACKIACLEDYIETLPNGYDTVIGEGGINLSGGQKQRLAIARALVQKTEIILFDEATSSLDNETQNKIQKAIENMQGKYTLLIIAHRLSTIKTADRILYLENGKIEAEGKHDDLMKNFVKYRNLYESEIIN